MRKGVTLLLVFVLSIASYFSVLLPAEAATKTIVVPNDYSTISEAIANAANGDTIFFKEGTYEGPLNQTLVINKSLSCMLAQA
jgi:hypothetical protein